MIKYEVIIYWSEEDEVFVADVPELPGCSAHGATQESALSNAQDAIRLWIDTAREFGDPVPQPKGRRLILAGPTPSFIKSSIPSGAASIPPTVSSTAIWTFSSSFKPPANSPVPLPNPIRNPKSPQ